MTEYIEREAAYESLLNGMVMTGYQSRALDCISEFSIPAADVRPVVKAHWYWDKDGMDWNIGAWRCSACKAMSPMWWNADKGSPMHKSGHKFCPNCGAQIEYFIPIPALDESVDEN